MRLLVITARYPTADRPAAGSFVQERLAGADAVVVAPRSYAAPGWWRYARLLWRALTVRGRFDGVECHFLLPTGPIAVLAAWLRRLPLVVYAHGGDVREMANRNRLFGALAGWVVRRADAIATNSAQTAEQVARLGGEASLIPPGIDLTRFRATPRPATRRVLYLGGDVGHKGVEVARRLADTLAGPGIGEVRPAEIPALLSAHDVLLVPSHEEPFGLVAAEAIASGRWVVARAVGGLREVVTDGLNGTLVWNDDFAAALASVPDYDPAAVAATAQRFDVRRHRAAMAALWRDVSEQRRGRQGGEPSVDRS